MTNTPLSPPHPHMGDTTSSDGKCPFGYGNEAASTTATPATPSSARTLASGPPKRNSSSNESTFFSLMSASNRSLDTNTSSTSSSQETATEDENATGNMTGTLRWRSRGIFGKWSGKQFFVINDGILYRFRSQKDQTAREEVDLHGPEEPDTNQEEDEQDAKRIQIVEAVGITGKKHSLGIIRQGKPTLLLCADNHREMRRWIRNLRRAAGIQSNGKSKQEDTADQDKHMVRTLEAILDATVISDHNVRIMGFNSAAERMFGYKKEEIMGKSVNCLMPAMYSRFHDKYVQRYNVTDDKRLIGQPRALLAMDKEGKSFPIHLSLGEVPGSDGKKRYVAVFKDLKNVSGDKANSGGIPKERNSTATGTTAPTPARPYEHSKYSSPMDMAREYGVDVGMIENGKDSNNKSSSSSSSSNNNNNSEEDFKSSFRSDVTSVTTTSTNNEKKPPASHPTTGVCPLGHTTGRKPSWIVSGENSATATTTATATAVTSANEQDSSSDHGSPQEQHNASMSSISVDGAPDDIEALPSLENLGVFIRSTKIQLVGRMMDTFERLKHQVSEEFQVLEQQFSRMNRTIEIIEEENLRMQRDIEDRDSEIARLRTENDNLMRTSDRYNLLQVLNNASTYRFFLDYSRQRGCSEMVLFWKDATDFKRKHAKQLTPTDQAIKEALAIHSKYLDPSSPYEINISYELKQFVSKKLSNPAPGMFDMLCDDVLSALNHDLFSEWIHTSMGKTCLSELALVEK